MKLKPEQRVPIAEAQRRALEYLQGEFARGARYTKASSVAIEIWLDHQMTSQGAGAAASRILKSLERGGLVRWNSNRDDWGWIVTAEGRAALRKLVGPPTGEGDA